MYHYSWKDQALHQLGGLSKTVALTIADKVKNYLTQEPRGNNSKPLKGRYLGLWRYRIGDYRVTYAIEESEKMIIITRVSHRKDGY